MADQSKRNGNTGASRSRGAVDYSKSWYERWHDKDHHVLTHWLIFFVIVVVAWALLYKQIANWVQSLNQPGVVVHLAPRPATQLTLDPQTETLKVGDTFPVNIMLDTAGNHIDGVDIFALHYDPTLLTVIDDSAKAKGVQITPGPILPVNAYNLVDSKSGSIKFSQLVNPGGNFMGQGVLATIHFKALSAGTAYLKFDYSQGSTTDSNAAYHGKDELSKVVDGIYTITK